MTEHEPLWTDGAMHAAYTEAFGKPPDVHHWALLSWMRDEYQTLVAELRDALDGMRGIAKHGQERIAELEADHSESLAYIDHLQAREAEMERTLKARVATLEAWKAAAQEVIARGVELMTLEQLSQWDAVRTVQERAGKADGQAQGRWEPVEYDSIYTPQGEPISPAHANICEAWSNFNNEHRNVDGGIEYAICRRQEGEVGSE